MTVKQEKKSSTATSKKYIKTFVRQKYVWVLILCTKTELCAQKLYCPGFSLLGGEGERGESASTGRTFVQSPHLERSPIRLPSHQIFIPPLNNNIFMLELSKNFIFSCSHCSCTIILTLFSLYTQAMLILILIEVQYLQNVAFSFKKVRMVKFIPPQIPTT